MKTPMEELIEDLKIFLPPSAYAVLNNFESHLEKEKNMFIDFYHTGEKDARDQKLYMTRNRKDGEEYYNEKFSK